MADSCCRAPVGADMKFFENLSSTLTEMENRGADKILMDLSVPTKKALYDRLLAQAKRISSITGER